MSMTEFDALMDEAERRPLVGWDVGYDGRISSRLPWDFTAMVTEHARRSPDLLDLGTGGGEWLGDLPHRPARTVATEGWPPNVPIARARLAPLGIEVHDVAGTTPNAEQEAGAQAGALPFADGAFHLITSRHEAYLPGEVHRLLARGGMFLTQQVASDAADDLYRLFDAPIPAVPHAWSLALAVRQLEEAGLAIEETGEGFEEMRFADVGALAWYLKNLPFLFPSFSIAAARARLREIGDTGRPAIVRQGRFWLKARKPG